MFQILIRIAAACICQCSSNQTLKMDIPDGSNYASPQVYIHINKTNNKEKSNQILPQLCSKPSGRFQLVKYLSFNVYSLMKRLLKTQVGNRETTRHFPGWAQQSSALPQGTASQTRPTQPATHSEGVRPIDTVLILPPSPDALIRSSVSQLPPKGIGQEREEAVLPVLPSGVESRKGVVNSGRRGNRKSSANADISLPLV